MVKSKTPSNKVTAAIDPAEPTRDTGHPLLNESTITKLLQNAAARNHEDKQEALIEKISDWKAALNRIASSPDGQLLLANMFKFAGFFTPASNAGNGVALVEMEGRRKFYSLYVRPYLDPKVRKEIE